MRLLQWRYVHVVVTMPASPDLIRNMSSDHLDIFHGFPSCSLPYPPPKCHNMSSANFCDMLKGDVFDSVESLNTCRGNDPSYDPYSLYLGRMPMKIMLTTAFNFFTDFSKAFDKFRRVLTIISAFLYKLMRALTTSEWVWDEDEWLMLLQPPTAPSWGGDSLGALST